MHRDIYFQSILILTRSIPMKVQCVSCGYEYLVSTMTPVEYFDDTATISGHQCKSCTEENVDDTEIRDEQEEQTREGLAEYDRLQREEDERCYQYELRSQFRDSM